MRRTVVLPAQRAGTRGDCLWIWWLTGSRKTRRENSMVRREAPHRIPCSAGRNLEGYSWVWCLTWRRKVKGKTAWQPTSDRVQVYGAMRWGTRATWWKLDCLNPNLQKMQWSIHRKDTWNRCRFLRPHGMLADATPRKRSDSQWANSRGWVGRLNRARTYGEDERGIT